MFMCYTYPPLTDMHMTLVRYDPLDIPDGRAIATEQHLQPACSLNPPRSHLLLAVDNSSSKASCVRDLITDTGTEGDGGMT